MQTNLVTLLPKETEYIAKVAQQHPDVVMGRYGITGRELRNI